jgi:linoleoyl-CoA desaturase
MDNTWAIHQLFTPLILLKNAIVNWYTGGLNHQIEHHIFPHISQSLLEKSKNSKETANVIYLITNTKRCEAQLSPISNT